MKKHFQVAIIPVIGMVILSGCRKQNQQNISSDPIGAARHYVETALQASTTHIGSLQSNTGYFTTANRQLIWDKAVLQQTGSFKSVWVPVNYPASRYIYNNLDRHRLFNTNYLQHLRVWEDSASHFHSELVTYMPDSNYSYGQERFSGIVLVKDWQNNFIKEYKFEKNGRIKKMMPRPVSQRTVADPRGQMIIQLCYYSSGYNEGEGVEPYYWTMSLGCEVYTLEDGGHATEQTDAGYYWNTGSGGTTNNEPPTLPIVAVLGGNNIIGNIKDYTKCFDNIAGFGQHYSVTLCVSQPVPGTRDAWGFTGNYVTSSLDIISAGHTFLILNQWDFYGRVTRNVGFYPAQIASPATPIVPGQLSNDEEHNYNISLTIEMDNSQFFTVLDFISHGNDPGFNYDLNANNCSTFAVRALRSAGISLPFNPGTWPGGAGFNPGDLGEDIRNMPLKQGMTKTTEKINHPNWGICY